MAPQLIYLALVFYGFGATCAKHGQQNTYSAGHSFVAVVLGLSLQYWGGFYDVLLGAR